MASDWKPSFQLMPESAWQPPAGNFPSIGTSFMRFAPTDSVFFRCSLYIPVAFEDVPTAINGSAKSDILKMKIGGSMQILAS